MIRTFIFYIVISVVSSCSYLDKQANNFVQNALKDTTFIEVIPQDAGGNLICEVRYWDDFSEVTREINYIYESTNKNRYQIGKGIYSNKRWAKDEQIQTVGNWSLMKTSIGRNSERILIGQLNDSIKWTEFDITPKSVEDEELWKVQQINSNPYNGDSKIEILSVDKSGRIIVEYEYAKKGRIFSFITGKRKLLYTLNKQTGSPILSSVYEN